LAVSTVSQLITAQGSQILSTVLAVGKQLTIGTGSRPDIKNFCSGQQLRCLLRNPSITPDEVK
jgi:hypothetical protein